MKFYFTLLSNKLTLQNPVLKLSLLFLASITLLSITSCKKEDEPQKPLTVKISGFIVDQMGGAVKDKLVRIYKQEGSGWAIKQTIYGQDRSNDSGYYEIEISTTYDEFLWIDIVNIGDYLGSFTHYFKITGSTLNKDFTAHIPGYLNVYLENKYQYYDSVLIGFGIPPFSYPQGFVYNGKAGAWIGNKTFITPAGKNIKISYSVNKKGETTNYTDSIDIPFNDTAFYKGSF